MTVLRVSAKNQKERTRAPQDSKQSLFRKLSSQEKNIPHLYVGRIQAAVAGLDRWCFYPGAGQVAKQFFLNSTNLVD
jgi:hypothetical protein